MRHYVWETTVLEFGELCVLSASRPKSQEVCGMHLANSPLLMYYKSDWLGGADLLSGWNQSQAHLVDWGASYAATTAMTPLIDSIVMHALDFPFAGT